MRKFSDPIVAEFSNDGKSLRLGFDLLRRALVC